MAIIGNGFDLNHGMKTDYPTIIEKMKEHQKTTYIRYEKLLNDIKNGLDNKIKKNKSEGSLRRKELIMLILELKAKKWYEFEMIANAIAGILSYMDINYDSKYEKTVREYNKLFEEIKRFIYSYLQEEDLTEKRKNIKIQKYLDENTYALNFNYTSTVKMYGCKQFYVHGSLEENCIVLGYDDWDDGTFDLTMSKNRLWLKNSWRIFLEFDRFLKNNTSLKENERMEAFHEYKDLFIKCRYRGIDNKDCEQRKYGNCIRIFHSFDREKKNDDQWILDVDVEKIDTILIMGHGIQADNKYLQSVFNNCKNARKAILFTYSGEKEEEIKVKEGAIRSLKNDLVIERESY